MGRALKAPASRTMLAGTTTSVRQRGFVSPRLWRSIAGFALALVLWELASRLGWVPIDFVPPPSRVALEILTQAQTARWWLSTARTLLNWLIAIVSGCVIAIPLGLAIGSSEILYRALRVPLEFCRAISPVALIPVVVLIAGATPRAAIALAVYGCVWPLLIQTVYGVRSVDPLLRQVALAYGINRGGVLRHLTIASAMPYILTGLSVSSALSLIAIISTEIIIGVGGVGNEINIARSSGAVVSAYAFTIWTGVLGLAIAQLIGRLKRRLLRWQPSKESRT